jgi:protoporphyrinogen oxidase
MPPVEKKHVVIIGGGPAGLTAAYQLCKAGITSVVLEKDDVVGGISRTVNHQGYLFDIGGHRFYTKVAVVQAMWREVLSNGEFLRRKRLSRIYYNKRFFQYPIDVLDALRGLGLWNSLLVVLSYLRAKMRPIRPVETLEQYLINHFGRRLYETFFKTYTEKVWGLRCDEISAEWGAQRIKGLSLRTALKNALFLKEARPRGGAIKSLIEEFDYPRKGPGMMWEMVAESVIALGGKIHLNSAVSRVLVRDGRVHAVEAVCGEQRRVVRGSHFITSMPLRELTEKLEPAAPDEVLAAARNLGYRDFLTVALIVDQKDLFPDNWIYIHDPNVKVGRIQNFKRWSPHMVPDPNKTCVGMEYFCFEGDGLWSAADDSLVELAKAELVSLGLADEKRIEGGTVVRMPKAYPVYDTTYAESLRVVREFLKGLGNIQTVGRNGMHKYNNQDHSMLTAMLAVKNILGANYDLWRVNADQEYLEEVPNSEAADEIASLAETQPLVPTRRYEKASSTRA